jgi:hypothetical protein
MQNVELANQVIRIVTEYFQNKLGKPLSISLKPTCFCMHNPECRIGGDGPMAVPDVGNKNVQIHINSNISLWYPGQLLYQYAHELWHAYEFAQFGINYSWEAFKDRIEPYAYAASLCALSERMMPQYILSDESQRVYFEAEKDAGPERSIYSPGAKLAGEVGYDLQKLYKQYLQTVSPQIVSSLIQA